MACCGVNQTIIHFYEASILPSVCSSVHHFLQIILVLNLYCGRDLNEFLPPNSSDDLCLLFCLFLFRWSGISVCIQYWWLSDSAVVAFIGSYTLYSISASLEMYVTHTANNSQNWRNGISLETKIFFLSKHTFCRGDTTGGHCYRGGATAGSGRQGLRRWGVERCQPPLR